MSSFPNLKHEDTKRILASVCMLVLITIGAGLFSEVVAILSVLIGAFVLGVLFVMHYHREAAVQQVKMTENLQDLQFLYTQISPRKPLAYLTGWSASPALAGRLYSLIQEEKPETIIELGSGVSTIAMAYAVENVGKGKIISLDHDERYAEKNRIELKRHHLDHLASVVYAPLVPTQTKTGNQPWYDLSDVSGLHDINLLVVDGPPRGTCADARLPAYEKLSSLLSPGAIVVIDDSGRKCEKNSLAAWTQSSIPALAEDIPSEKGVSVRYLA